MPQLVNFFRDSFWITIGSVEGAVFFLWLALRSGRRYTVEDTEAHAAEYGEIIKEGHGGLTAFLWVTYAAFFIWTIIYFVINWEQFYVIFASA